MSESVPTLFGLTGRALHRAQVLLIGAPAFVVFGYNQAGVGPLATLDSWVNTFPEIDTVHTTGDLKSHNSTSKGAVIAAFQIGALIGALSTTFFSDRLGRRWTIFIGALLTIIGQVLQVASFGLIQFTVGRIILGLGVGQFSVAVPVWQSESSAAKNRGQHVIIDGMCMCLGYALCNWIDFGLSRAPESNTQWRVPLALSLLPSLMILLSVFLFPESPRWLVQVNRIERAELSLAKLKGNEATEAEIRAEIAGIHTSLEMTAHAKASLLEIFKKDDEEKLLYRFTLCVMLQFFQQMCGGNLISVYASTIFEDNLGMSASLSKILASCALTWKFLCCFISFFAIDRLGRRVCFIVSGTGMACCMLAMAVTNSMGKDNHGASIASAVFIFLFNLFYPIGFLGGNFLYTTEIAPARLRVAMSAVSTGNHWLWNFVVVMVTPVALDTIGYRYYVMYTVLSACIPLGIYFFYPETKNRNLELINQVFRDASSPWEIVSMAKQLPEGEVPEAQLAAVSKMEGAAAVEMKENA
ncbi:general substrate transporter [Aspergillus egyptiacus]|nr:general substrate transporter [Aspergillus egyptiacus]